MLKLRVQIPDIGKEYDVQCNEKAYVEDGLEKEKEMKRGF